MSLIFTEKYVEPVQHSLWNYDYQPTSLNHFVGNQMIAETIDSFLRSDHIPNLIFCGPNGCGKTTMAKILAKEYLGPAYDSCNMEIIGSIYRGKNVVSEKNDKKKASEATYDCPNIINFIRKKLRLSSNKCRIVTIYDFDCMTDEAQMALRRIIEIHSEKVRFIFICNNLNNIIEAIQSRTLILKFQPVSIDEIIQRLKEITTARLLTLNDDIYDAIGIMSGGDLKQAINILQVFANSHHHLIDNFYNIFNIPSIKSIQELIRSCLLGDGNKAFSIIDQMVENGYNVTDILDIMIKVLMYTKDLTEPKRVYIIEETIKIICINEQSSSITHLYKLVTSIIKGVAKLPKTK
jgi:DNA polymerase III delta prime subunit